MAASQSSSGSSGSSKEDAGAGNGASAPPTEEAPGATGSTTKKDDRRNEDPADPGRGNRRPWVHPDVPEFAPRCCSCNKSGIAALAHQGEITMDTLATRGTGPDGSVRLAICLAPNTRGIIRGHDLTRRCGHTPCPRCTIRLEDQYMCACCAARVQAQGSGQHGAGRLPAPLPRANRRDRQGPRRLPPPRTGGRTEKEAAPERAEAKKEEDRAEADPPQEENRGQGSEAARVDTRREDPRDPLPDRTEPRESPPRRESRERERTPRRTTGRNRRHPVDRTYRTDSEDTDGSAEEEEVTEEERDPDRGEAPGGSRRSRTPEHPPDTEDKYEGWPRTYWCTVGCGRFGRENVGTCCGACEDTGGMEHTRDCDRRNGRPPPDYSWHWDPPGKGGGWDPYGGGGRKGSGWEKGRPSKKAAKAKRDYDRSVRRRQEGRYWTKAPFPAEAYRLALGMGVAASTRRSWRTRIRTWDAAVERLRREELLAPVEDPTRLTPETAHKVVAFLKAQGYRSAELYLSAAMRRHKTHHEVDGPLSLASKDAVQLAVRGRGPPVGKQPAPMPQAGHPQFNLLMVGIWYLLRVSELINLELEDVAIRQSTAGWTVALVIRKSKTDQESQGKTIARDCVCLAGTHQGAHRLCPVHTLWNQAIRRVKELRALGYTGQKVPLFTTDDGGRLSERHVLTAVELAARMSGEPLRDDGQARYGTHSLRVAGAVLAFQSGLSEAVVWSLGRWRSEKAMLAYLRGVPLIRAASAAETMVTAMLDAGGNPLWSTNFRPLVQAGRVTGGWAPGARDMTGAPTAWEPDEVDQEEGPRVRNNLTGLVHRLGNFRGPAAGWTTRCGWHWSELGTAGQFLREEGAQCGRCYNLKQQ